MDVRPPPPRSAATAEEEGDLDPAVEWRQAGEEQDVVEIALPGFRREQVRVQVDNYGVLRVTGVRPPARGGGRSVRFRKDLLLPDNCDVDSVRARFEDEKLIITIPIVASSGDAAASPLRTPPREPHLTPLPAPLPPAAKSTLFETKPLPPPSTPLKKSNFFGGKTGPPPQHSDQAPTTVSYPPKATAVEKKPFPAPAIAPVPKKDGRGPGPLPPLPPGTKWTAATLPEPPKPPALPDTATDVPLLPPSPPAPPPPPPPRQPVPKDKTKKKHGKLQGIDGKVGLSFMEEMMKKKEKMEAGEVREKAATAMEDVKREVAPPATRDLVMNMLAAAAVLVGIALSLWRVLSS